jgi:hypothetical protein
VSEDPVVRGFLEGQESVAGNLDRLDADTLDDHTPNGKTVS